jgi:hypothetical protein
MSQSSSSCILLQSPVATPNQAKMTFSATVVTFCLQFDTVNNVQDVRLHEHFFTCYEATDVTGLRQEPASIHETSGREHFLRIWFRCSLIKLQRATSDFGFLHLNRAKSLLFPWGRKGEGGGLLRPSSRCSKTDRELRGVRRVMERIRGCWPILHGGTSRVPGGKGELALWTCHQNGSANADIHYFYADYNTSIQQITRLGLAEVAHRADTGHPQAGSVLLTLCPHYATNCSSCVIIRTQRVKLFHLSTALS